MAILVRFSASLKQARSPQTFTLSARRGAEGAGKRVHSISQGSAHFYYFAPTKHKNEVASSGRKMLRHCYGRYISCILLIPGAELLPRQARRMTPKFCLTLETFSDTVASNLSKNDSLLFSGPRHSRVGNRWALLARGALRLAKVFGVFNESAH